jgi:hypothetical protein
MEMHQLLVVNFLFSLFEAFSFIIFAFSIFRIPIRYNFSRIFVFSGLLMIPYVIKAMFYPQNESAYHILLFVVVAVLALTVLFEIPILYSVLIISCTLLAFTSLQSILFLLMRATDVFTVSELQKSDSVRNLMLLINSTLILGASALLQRKRLGFMFNTDRFQFERRKLTPRDLYVASVFVTTIPVVQAIILIFMQSGSNTHAFFLLFLGVTSTTLLGYGFAWWFNRIEIDKRDRRKK